MGSIFTSAVTINGGTALEGREERLDTFGLSEEGVVNFLQNRDLNLAEIILHTI